MKNLFFVLFVAIFLAGCGQVIVEKHSYILPDTKREMKNYYVEHSSADTHNLNFLISQSLMRYGVKIVNQPKVADVIVTYIDRWIWGGLAGNFLIDLKIQFRDSNDRYPIIVGEIKRNMREENSVVVREIIDEMMLKSGVLR